jgi:autotransporter-associated beta strand protein
VPITITSGTLVLTGNNTSSAPITISSHVFTIETTGDAVLSGAITGSGALFKKGTSSLTLGSSHTRVGETHINDGTLRLTAPALSTSHALLLETDSTMELDFTGTQTVDQLIFGGVSQLTGTYGSLTSTATYKLAQITGSGLLEVTTTNFSFNEWATHKNLTVSNNSEGDDPDHDGISNVLEFVLGGNPLSTSTTILPTASVSGNDFIYTFKRTDFSESDRILYVQFSTDLNDWSESHNVSSNSSVSGSATITVAENGNADDTITVTRPKGTATQLFARIFIEED